MAIETPLFWLDTFGLVVFAISGALVAARKGMDIVGFALMATVTGIGGGTFRDLVLGLSPVFWVREPRYLVVCVVVGMATWLVAHRLNSRLTALLWADAVGVAFYTAVGTKVGLDAGASVSVAVLMGVMTSSFGGIVRDVIANEPSLILQREIYITACVAGAFAYLGVDALGLSQLVAMTVSFLVTFAVRGSALAFGLSLPGYRAKIEKARDAQS
ncbi:MAG: trimeric intracellular cation channel family protein [Rhodospirillum sp.]|nr:trimeric intracellular cation channel family protein [Rhodospirillum sp.]MCF8488220.1 trimeric intracellular cation channel family protein [Rhodospirillum sp.]MCF8502517.1 trimeric intracellular cation channel family protein [Rhodospirillum sp.]